MRLFIAIELSDDLRSHLVQMQQRVRRAVSDLSFTRPANLHLTLKFLGEVADDDVTGIADALRSIPPVGEFALIPGGVVCFPGHGRVRVISAELRPTDQLMQLQQEIESAMEGRGFGREQRRYQPHITLARARRPLAPAMRQKLSREEPAAAKMVAMQVREFVLMHSQLHPQGAQYTAAARFYINLSE